MGYWQSKKLLAFHVCIIFTKTCLYFILLYYFHKKYNYFKLVFDQAKNIMFSMKENSKKNKQQIPPIIEAIEQGIKFVANKNSDLFEKPVKEQNPSIYPHYEKIIKHPMDIRTIKDNREKGLYKSFDSIDRDITLMYENCITFNSKGNYKNNRYLKIGRKCLEEWNQFKQTFVEVDSCEDSVDESFDKNEVPNWFPEIMNFYCETCPKEKKDWTRYTYIMKKIQEIIKDKGEKNMSEGEKKFSEMKPHSGKNKPLYVSFDKLFKKVADTENNFGWQYYEGVTSEVGRHETLKINLRLKNLHKEGLKWFTDIINFYCEISPSWEFYKNIRDPIQQHIESKINKSQAERLFLNLYGNRSEYKPFDVCFDKLFKTVADSDSNFGWQYRVINRNGSNHSSNFMIKLKFKEEFFDLKTNHNKKYSFQKINEKDDKLNQSNKRRIFHDENTQHVSTKRCDGRIDDDFFDIKDTTKRLKKNMKKEFAEIKQRNISFEAEIMDLKKEIVELKQTNTKMEERFTETNRQNEKKFADMKENIVATDQQLLLHINQMQIFQNLLSRIENKNGSVQNIDNFRHQKNYNNSVNSVAYNNNMNYQRNPVAYRNNMNYQTNLVGHNYETNPVAYSNNMNYQTNPVGHNYQTNPVGHNYQTNPVRPNNHITF